MNNYFLHFLFLLWSTPYPCVNINTASIDQIMLLDLTPYNLAQSIVVNRPISNPQELTHIVTGQWLEINGEYLCYRNAKTSLVTWYRE